MTSDANAGAALHHLLKADAELAVLVEQVGRYEPEVRNHQSPFEALTHSIVYQQLSGKAAGAIHARLLARFAEGRHPSPTQILALTDEELREIGLSRAKCRALRDLACHTTDGRLPTRAEMDRLSDADIVARVCSITGIGLWTAQMMLMFYLRRADILPATDLGIRKGFMLTFGGELPAASNVVERAERWRPFRSVASWYLWQATYL